MEQVEKGGTMTAGVLIRRVLVAFLAAGVLAGPGHSQAARPITGIPAADHAWTLADFDAATRVVAGLKPEDMPRASSTPAGAVFARMTGPSIYAPCSNPDMPANARALACSIAFEDLKKIQVAYSLGSLRDEQLTDELLLVMAMGVGLTTEFSLDMEEAVKTLDTSAADLNTRVAEMDKLRSGFGQYMLGSVMALKAKVPSESQEARIKLAASVAAGFPRILLPPEKRAGFAGDLRKLAAEDPNEGVRRELAAFLQ